MQTKDKSNTSKPVPSRTAIALEQLYPRRSILADMVDLTKKNTDLPPSAALFDGYSLVSSALAQAGFALRIEADTAVSPNLQLAVLVGDDANPGYLLHSIAQRVISTPRLREVPSSITSASLFAHVKSNAISVGAANANSSGSTEMDTAGDTRCVSLLTMIECEDWLKGLHTESNLGKLRRQLYACCKGQPLHRWSATDGDEYTAPVHMSMLIACRQSPFFSELAGLFFSSKFIRQFLLVLADDRPLERKPLYEDVGISSIARAWKHVWQGILAGPRAYVPTPEAKSEYQAWWLGRLAVGPSEEHDLRKVGRASWKYALVIQALIDPSGSIGVEAIRFALAIADMHLAAHAFASRRLASETADERLTRKVYKYIVDSPKAPRGEVMKYVRGAEDPAALNRVLTRIAEMYAGKSVADRAVELRAASRVAAGGDTPRPKS